MFEKYDPDLSLGRKEYESEMPPLRERLGVLQREFRDRGIPLLLVVEGWRVSGISETINKLSYSLDPRGYRVHHTQEPSDEERVRPMMWRFWIRTPAKGQIAIFDRSWYSRTVVEKSANGKEKGISSDAVADIVNMEDQLADDGVLIVKLFLHISKKEQKKRLEKLRERHPDLVKEEKGALERLNDYDRALPLFETLIMKSDTAKNPWTVVEAHDKHFTVTKVYRTILERMEERLRVFDAAKAAPVPAAAPPAPDIRAETPALLRSIDLKKTLSEGEYEQQLRECEDRLKELQYAVHRNAVPVIIVFEGWDAAGKGGAIIRLDRALNPRCSVVEPVSAPTQEEKSHHYLWRFYRRFPKNGDITIFDRSWYGRVMVERIEGFCTGEEWRRAFHEINEMEESLVGNGAVLLKFWLQIDRETQIQRFREREQDPLKKYKITDEDWRNREKWALYEVAVNDMLQKTSTHQAPWTIVESNDKYYSRIKIMTTVIREIEKRVGK
jgi:polyphosphate:AMP phosphotransferase